MWVTDFRKYLELSRERSGPIDTFMTMSERKRLDELLAARGLFDSRTKAAASVLAGEVSLPSAPERLAKPGMLVPDNVEVTVAERPRYVSRGGLKLERALAAFDIEVPGRCCLDV